MAIQRCAGNVRLLGTVAAENVDHSSDKGSDKYAELMVICQATEDVNDV
jgi:hypothetical protein